jgi:hypothetical protein
MVDTLGYRSVRTTGNEVPRLKAAGAGRGRMLYERSDYWGHAVVGKFYQPIKKSLTIRFDADVLAWLTCRGWARKPPSGKRRGPVLFVGAGSSDPLKIKDSGRRCRVENAKILGSKDPSYIAAALILFGEGELDGAWSPVGTAADHHVVGVCHPQQAGIPSHPSPPMSPSSSRHACHSSSAACSAQNH